MFVILYNTYSMSYIPQFLHKYTSCLQLTDLFLLPCIYLIHTEAETDRNWWIGMTISLCIFWDTFEIQLYSQFEASYHYWEVIASQQFHGGQRNMCFPPSSRLWFLLNKRVTKSETSCLLLSFSLFRGVARNVNLYQYTCIFVMYSQLSCHWIQFFDWLINFRSIWNSNKKKSNFLVIKV